MFRTKTGRFRDSEGVKKMRVPMMGRRTAPRGATMRITERKWRVVGPESSMVDMGQGRGR